MRSLFGGPIVYDETGRVRYFYRAIYVESDLREIHYQIMETVNVCGELPQHFPEMAPPSVTYKKQEGPNCAGISRYEISEESVDFIKSRFFKKELTPTG